MTNLTLPPSSSGKQNPDLSTSRSVIIIGANGSGKSRFMDEMESLAKNNGYSLSALSASFPEREESLLPGSIDALYRQVTKKLTYMRTDAVSELDKLVYLLFVDELEYLFSLKEAETHKGKLIKLKKTKLDKISRLWEKLFPGNRIIRSNGSIMFATRAGDDLISSSSLSQGEKTVLYYAAAVLFAMPEAEIFIDSPSLFIHPTLIGPLWDSIESLRPDCKFIYNSVDIDFIASRKDATFVWVKNYDSEKKIWDYEILKDLSVADNILMELTGSRRPVIFVEGDTQHSIDIKLYGLVFRDWDIRPLGSCNKVIESTRTFNDLKQMHHLRSRGIVDRDRRTAQEVEYLRNKEILVPDVAEVENIFLIEDIIRIMAKRRLKDAEKIIGKVKKEVILTFKQKSEQQALQHVRHIVKREIERKIDSKFSCITALETHLKGLIYTLRPRSHYNRLRQEFAMMVRDYDYSGILRVFNHKPMLPDSGVAQLLGYKSKDEYITGVLNVLAGDDDDSQAIRQIILNCLHAMETPK